LSELVIVKIVLRVDSIEKPANPLDFVPTGLTDRQDISFCKAQLLGELAHGRVFLST